MTNLSVTFWTNPREEIRATRSLYLRQTSFWVFCALYLSLPTPLIYFFFLDPLVPLARPDDWQNKLLTIAFLVVCVLFLYLLPWIAVHRQRQSGGAGSDGPHTILLEETGFQVESPYSRIEISWQAIRSAIETRDFFLFQTGSLSAQMLPKRVLSPGMLTETRDLLQRRLAGRAKIQRDLGEA